MDHDQAVRQKATERYLLNELDPGLRDEFEEHLFDCQDCALDVRAAAMFVEQSKTVLAEPSVTPVRVPFPAKTTAKVRWMGWLRPVFAVPVLALLTIVGYQNLITLPRMTQAMGKPQLLPSVMVNVSTRGTEVPEVTARKGGAFVVYVRIPPQAGYSQYTAALYNPENKLEWSLPIPMNAGQDTYLVEVPAANRQSGKYTLNIQGVTATGQSTPVGFPAAFEVKMEN